MNIEQLDRKRVLISRLIEEAKEHFRLFAEPCPMKILSAKYGTALAKVGGFPECIRELSMDGTITIIRKKTGGQVVLVNANSQFPQVTQKAS